MLSDFRELLKYIGGLVDKRMEKPEKDLISKLVTEQVIEHCYHLSHFNHHPHTLLTLSTIIPAPTRQNRQTNSSSDRVPPPRRRQRNHG